MDLEASLQENETENASLFYHFECKTQVIEVRVIWDSCVLD